MKIMLNGDTYNICKRIKNFDKNYCVVFDFATLKYLVYTKKHYGNYEIINNEKLMYVCTIPYSELDARTIKHLFTTQIKNLQEIIKQIDEENLMLEKQNNKTIKNQALTVAENTMRKLSK